MWGFFQEIRGHSSRPDTLRRILRKKNKTYRAVTALETCCIRASWSQLSQPWTILPFSMRVIVMPAIRTLLFVTGALGTQPWCFQWHLTWRFWHAIWRLYHQVEDHALSKEPVGYNETVRQLEFRFSRLKLYWRRPIRPKSEAPVNT